MNTHEKTVTLALKQLRDYAFMTALAFVTIVSLVIIGNTQANQYRSVVERIDHNTQAIVCILRIPPEERTEANLAACLPPGLTSTQAP